MMANPMSMWKMMAVMLQQRDHSEYVRALS